MDERTYEQGMKDGLMLAHAVASTVMTEAEAAHRLIAPSFWGRPTAKHYEYLGRGRAASEIGTAIFDFVIGIRGSKR